MLNCTAAAFDKILVSTCCAPHGGAVSVLGCPTAHSPMFPRTTEDYVTGSTSRTR
jgi:hypothetical protein